MNIKDFKWTREPDDYTLTDDKIEIITQPGTDLWQRTYYHFRNDNAPVLQIETEEKFFSFSETASLYLVYCLLKVYARCRFQKHKFFYFLKAETMYRQPDSLLNFK